MLLNIDDKIKITYNKIKNGKVGYLMENTQTMSQKDKNQTYSKEQRRIMENWSALQDNFAIKVIRRLKKEEAKEKAKK